MARPHGTSVLSRRPLIPYIAGFLFAAFILFTYLNPGSAESVTRYAQERYGGGVYPPSRMSPTLANNAGLIDASKPWLLKGSAPTADVVPSIGMMGKLTNETARAELGRATWKLLHTITLRYPVTPTQAQRDALSSYFYLTAQLYPCGECAAEFTQLLTTYPPQTSTRTTASQWLCFVHNLVNERLKKPIFDCAKDLDSTYDCGCGPNEISKNKDVLKGTKPQRKSNTALDADMEMEGIVGGPFEGKWDDLTGVGMIKGGR